MRYTLSYLAFFELLGSLASARAACILKGGWQDDVVWPSHQERQWCSGNIQASHACAPGSTPGWRISCVRARVCRNGMRPMLASAQWNMTSAGLERAIPGSVGRCLIHWATRPSDSPVSPHTQPHALTHRTTLMGGAEEHVPFRADLLLDSLRRSPVKIGTIQRRLAWPLRRDDTHKSRSVSIFCPF